MLSKLNRFLNILLSCCIGVFLGNGLYAFGDYKLHPELYAAQSAPWYTSILSSGIIVAVLVVVIVVINLVIHHKSK